MANLQCLLQLTRTTHSLCVLPSEVDKRRTRASLWTSVNAILEIDPHDRFEAREYSKAHLAIEFVVKVEGVSPTKLAPGVPASRPPSLSSFSLRARNSASSSALLLFMTRSWRNCDGSALSGVSFGS